MKDVSNGTAHSGISTEEATSRGKHKFFANVLPAIFSPFEFTTTYICPWVYAADVLNN